MTLDDLERKNGVLMEFSAIFACESLYRSQGGATVANTTVPMANVYYGPDGPSPSDMQFSKL